ncbi:MAG: hypothetical protein IPN84_01360 [Sphingomonadales bacterium]|nr:hypothetical protein [Sphingomonadales bacterium]
MMRRVALGLGLAAVAVLLGGCDAFGPPPYHYKMTIEVQTPQGVKSFSSVRAISYRSRLEGAYIVKVKGEAVVIDLPGGPVFALLSGADGNGDYAGTIAEAALVSKVKPGGENRDYRQGQFAEIYPTVPSIENYMPENPLPLLVRFRDITDPTSVERVEPAAIGPGVVLRRIAIAKTDEPVTTGIEGKLPYFGKSSGYLSWRQTLDNDDPRRRLTRSDFTAADEFRERNTN